MSAHFECKVCPFSTGDGRVAMAHEARIGWLGMHERHSMATVPGPRTFVRVIPWNAPRGAWRVK